MKKVTKVKNGIIVHDKKSATFLKNSGGGTNRLDDEGRWVTTENGHHVHISEGGAPDKGNPHVLSKMNGGTSKKGNNGKSGTGKKSSTKSTKGNITVKSFSTGKNVSADDIVKKLGSSSESERESAVQEAMDIIYDHPETYDYIMNRSSYSVRDRLSFEMGPDNTNAIEERVKPYKEKRRKELQSLVPAPKKNSSTQASINGKKVVLSNSTDYNTYGTGKTKRFFEVSIYDEETGERIGSYATEDYNQALEKIEARTDF